MLAGVWTQGSLDQLRSNGFSILHISYETIVEVFRKSGIEVFYEETSTDEFLRDQIGRWNDLTQDGRDQLDETLRAAAAEQLEAFMTDLSHTVLRRVDRISVLPLHGTVTECQSIDQAISLIQDYDPSSQGGSLIRFEVMIRYDNGDRVTADFGLPADALAFLGSFQ